MSGSNTDPQIGGVSPQDRAKSLELVFSYLPPDDRRRQISEALLHSPGQSSLEGLIGARRNGRLVGAVFSQIESGKTATVWLPRLTVGESESTAANLFAATWAYLLQHQVVLAQTLLPMNGDTEEVNLRLGGICHLANLLYLVGPKDGSFVDKRSGQYSPDRAGKIVCPAVADTSSFDVAIYSASSHDQLVQVVEATYEGTLDCPGLAGVRSVDDVLAGYRSTGVFDPHHWLLIRHKQSNVGCLLLADHPRHSIMELLYLGLIPAARGRGWGKLLAGLARRLAWSAGRRRLVLAVDAANGPAVQTYTAMDFQTWQRRRLYVRRLGFADNWHTSFQQVIHDGCTTGGENSTAGWKPT